MSENSASAYTVLHLRFRLRVPPGIMLAHSREAATIIASVEGLIWKIWVLQEEEFEMGGLYLLPIAVCSNPGFLYPIAGTQWTLQLGLLCGDSPSTFNTRRPGGGRSVMQNLNTIYSVMP